MSIRVVIADDQAVVRSGFRSILEDEPDVEVVGDAEDGLAAVEVARGRRADVVLMDIRMPGLDRLEATRCLAGPGVEHPIDVIVVTTFDLDDYVFGALRPAPRGSCSRTHRLRRCWRRSAPWRTDRASSPPR
jgi:DNA-binding NarL/FixJ family response regulator